ncbi:ABC transporter permease [Akkermansiaceae bacterium]|jgi:ABC-2 type transport system permease protein|nr:ABC transporter permease [Akkermansiaceae bacterium]MDB4628595.1 ABC transporter permease [Akkermansiaceae bacterium]RZN92462.1 MAG: hypothetical protein EVB10_01340 [Verrucomicrobiaceae bacterium]HAE20033.1 hypothetical protein [Verrucomicrobiales bacterium]|tara:strand:+ start:469 stop:1221 length:753 start_codon:yes stop_codon:yes gene_type:complete
MRIFRILYFKELKSYFLSPFGWLILCFASLMQGFALTATFKEFSDNAVAESLVSVVFNSPIFNIYFLFLFPVLTMRLFSEENRSGTIEGLLTAPVRTWQVVLSKFLASYTTFLTLWITAGAHFYLFTALTDVPPPFTNGDLVGAFLIIALMGMLFTAYGCLASALTSSQIIAGVVCTFILIFHMFLGLIPNFFGEQIPAADFFNFISSPRHLVDFTRGLINTGTIVYYIATAVFFLFLTFHILDFRRWKP